MTAGTDIKQDVAQFMMRDNSVLEQFNSGRSANKGCYAISMATMYRRSYALWRIFNDGRAPLFIRTLAENFEVAQGKAMYLLRYNKIVLKFVHNDFFLPYYSITYDILTFGKYNHKHLAEVYYIDPQYVLWLANKFQPEKKKLQLLVEMASRFASVHYELTPPNRPVYYSTCGYVGKKGDKLENLQLKILYVKQQVDTYKPDFYIDQRVIAINASGERFSFTERAGGRSQTPKALSCHSRKMIVGDVIILSSARVMEHYESRGVKYTRLGYIKYAK